jgi:hypothetical protein
MHKTAYAFAKRKEHDFLVVGSRQQCIFHIFHKHKPTTLTKLRAIGSGTIPSSVTSTSTSQPPHFRRHQDQGMSNKLLVSMKCERLQGIQPLMMESFLFLKNDTSNDVFFFFNFPFKHRNEGLFPSVYIILYRIQQSQLPKANSSSRHEMFSTREILRISLS